MISQHGPGLGPPFSKFLGLAKIDIAINIMLAPP